MSSLFGGLSNRPQRLKYAGGEYREGMDDLRQSYGRDFARRQQGLRSSGVPEADVQRMLTDTTVGAQQQAGQLYGRALDYERQAREAKRARRRQRLGTALGIVASIPSQVAQFRMYNRALNPAQAGFTRLTRQGYRPRTYGSSGSMLNQIGYGG